MKSFFIYRRLSRFYDIFMKVNLLGVNAYARKQAVQHFQSNEKVFEIGVGTGLNIPHWENLETTKIVGVDISKEMLIQAAKKLSEKSNVELVNAKGQTLPFKNNTFDGVLMFLFLSQKLPHQTILKEIDRVLTKDAKIVVVDYVSPKSKIAHLKELIIHFFINRTGLSLKVDIEALIQKQNWKIIKKQRVEGMFGLLSLLEVKKE